jgi:hypothetical protein
MKGKAVVKMLKGKTQKGRVILALPYSFVNEWFA